MNIISVPRLYCPFEPVINQHAAAVEKHTDEWVNRFKLHPEKGFEEYKTFKYISLTARFYDTCDYERLCIANDIIVLLFLIDDLLDNQLQKTVLVQKEASLHHFIAEVKAITQGRKRVMEGTSEHVLAALTDVWQRLQKISSEKWLNSFAESIEKLFDIALWEFKNVNNDRLPSLNKYLELRQYLGGAHISTDLISPIEQIYLPESVMQHSIVQQITKTCRTIVCISNDLFSFTKEQSHGDEHNLISVLENERNISSDEAVLAAARIHDTEVRRFLFLQEQLPFLNTDAGSTLQRYSQALCRHIAGNMAWSMETKRYSFLYEDGIKKTT